MVIRVLSSQIPYFWDTIKFVAVNADEVDKKDLAPYCNELLHSLLGDKAQCFVRLDDKKVLLALIITRILADKITGKKYLYIQCMYSFQIVDEKLWRKDIQFVYDFAKSSECSHVSFDSRNKRIFEIAKLIGCEEVSRSFKYQIV
jgi:hypothetical protein